MHRATLKLESPGASGHSRKIVHHGDCPVVSLNDLECPILPARVKGKPWRPYVVKVACDFCEPLVLDKNMKNTQIHRISKSNIGNVSQRA